MDGETGNQMEKWRGGCNQREVDEVMEMYRVMDGWSDGEMGRVIDTDVYELIEDWRNLESDKVIDEWTDSELNEEIEGWME